ncbi:ParB-like protein [Sphingomonas sp. GlSt437]|uniref:ParB-like protein n=1 Tax=Sphingomonas sp. GlSt437 TaxID=3389970 RepID=UPI003A869589
MTHDYQPLVTPTPIRDLRPTQMTVGMHEVALKRQAWRDKCEKEGPEFVGRHMIPVVIGPKQRPWLVDHHHLALALSLEGQEHVLASVIADLSHLGRDEFLTVMDNRSWLHPFDAHGVRQDYDKLPRRIGKLTDDPYRSLAGAVLREGGYAKSAAPFAEFLWADFFRRRIDAKLVGKHFDQATERALTLAKDQRADHLPGWAGGKG